MEAQSGDSKTHLEGKKVMWDANDAITVVNRLGNLKVFKTATGELTGGYADFQSAEATGDFYKPNYKAYYPTSLYDAQTGKVSLPATQDFVMVKEAGSFGKGFNPMAAQATDNTLEFKNICGMLALQLKGDNITVNNISVTAKGGELLWVTGDLTLDGTDGAMTPTLGTLSNGSQTITLNCNNVVTLTNEAKTFYFVLPAGTLANGFDVVLTDSEGKIWSKSSATGADVSIVQNKINKMPELSVEVTAPVVPSSVTLVPSCSGVVYNLGGSVTVPSGSHTCEFGLVYSETNDQPTVADSKIVAGTDTFSGTKDFTADITGLTAGTTYHVRAYAMIEGVIYSMKVKNIVGGDAPQDMTWGDGKSPYQFTVGMDGDTPRKVRFSQGNLQYIGSAGKWKFADHQFDFIGNGQNGSSASDIDCDLFGWGMSGWNNGNYFYQPYSTSNSMSSPYTNSNGYGYGPTNGTAYTFNFTGDYANADWGVYNAISNGGNVAGRWRTLTNDEWEYLINTRMDGSGKPLYGEGKVGSCTSGLIILPDGWSCPAGVTDVTRGTFSWANVYSYSEWAKMEAAGAVFLLAAGGRNGSWVGDVGSNGGYWSSSYYESSNAYGLCFSSSAVYTNNGYYRYRGFSVRLVTEN